MKYLVCESLQEYLKLYEMRGPTASGYFPAWCGDYKTTTDISHHLQWMDIISKKHLNDKSYSKVFNESLMAVSHFLEHQGQYCGISKKMKETMPEKYVGEHGIPKNVIKQLMSKINFANNDEILCFIEKTYFICVLTVEENALLNKAGLSKKMPDGWEWNGNNADARYKAVGIELFYYPGKILNKIL